jgi:hypothetical protein
MVGDVRATIQQFNNPAMKQFNNETFFFGRVFSMKIVLL